MNDGCFCLASILASSFFVRRALSLSPHTTNTTSLSRRSFTASSSSNSSPFEVKMRVAGGSTLSLRVASAKRVANELGAAINLPAVPLTQRTEIRVGIIIYDPPVHSTRSDCYSHVSQRSPRAYIRSTRARAARALQTD